MKARPILMSAPMVRALLAGTKTQTRRAIKPQPECGFIVGGAGSPASPYGAPGDLLWVRETWAAWSAKVAWYAADQSCSDGIARPHYTPGKKRPSIFMPRQHSRLTLRITGVRVQRLHVISNDDCIAEGIEDQRAPRMQYCKLWESINGAGSWAANPFVWALTFEVLQKNVDEVLRG